MSWEERLNAAREIGYDFVELSIDESDPRLSRLDWPKQRRKAVREAVDRTGVRIQSLSLSAHRRFPLGSPSLQTRQRALTLFEGAIDLAVDIGIRLILVSGADNYYGESTEETRAWYLENLGRGLRKASSAGVLLGLENWDIQIDSLSKAVSIIDQFNSPWLQLYVDLGNLVYAGRDVLSELEHAQGHIAALHIKDTVPGRLRSVPLGEGKVPFREAFEALVSQGFHSPAVVELWTGEDPQALPIAARANRFVRTQMAEARNTVYNKIDSQEE